MLTVTPFDVIVGLPCLLLAAVRAFFKGEG